MVKFRLLFAIAITLLFLIVGLYLSGYATLALLGLDAELLKWNTYLIYYRALDVPAVAPHVAKIRWGGGLGFGISATLWLGCVVLALKPRPKSAHGEARFAGRSELARAGLLKPAPDGIVIGKIGSTLIRLPGQQFAILAAPTRSGKGVGIVIPNLLEYRDSIVVLDIKGENFELTSGWRAEQGQKIYKFNPYDTHTHRWNPMGYVASDPHRRINDIQAIAAMLYPDQGGEDKFWISQARNAFLAFSLYLYENYDEQRQQGYPLELLKFPTLGGILRLACGNGRNLKDYLQSLAEARFLSASAKVAFAGLLSQEKETFASIMGTLREPLNPFVSPIMDAATGGNDFRLNEVRKKPTTIYLVIPPHKLGECRVLVNLFFSQLINENTQQLPAQNPALKHQCLLLMDEFTAIGRVDKLADSITHMAGYNLRVFPIIQSKAQLEATYGKEVARTLITNHAVQIVFAPREQQDANDYSEMLGYTTVKRRSVTRGRDYSRSESEERRELMLPQELKALGPDKQIVFYEGLAQPVLCEKIKYYSDKDFRARVKPPVKIPALTDPLVNPTRLDQYPSNPHLRAEYETVKTLFIHYDIARNFISALDHGGTYRYGAVDKGSPSHFTGAGFYASGNDFAVWNRDGSGNSLSAVVWSSLERRDLFRVANPDQTMDLNIIRNGVQTQLLHLDRHAPPLRPDRRQSLNDNHDTPAQEHRGVSTSQPQAIDPFSRNDPRHPEHRDHAFFELLKRNLPPGISDEMVAHVLLEAKIGKVQGTNDVERVMVHEDRVFVMGKTPGFRAAADLAQTPPPIRETAQRSDVLDAERSLQRQHWMAQEQSQALSRSI